MKMSGGAASDMYDDWIIAKLMIKDRSGEVVCKSIGGEADV